MAKKSVILRNKKRERMVARFASKRAALKKIIADPTVSEEEFYSAQAKPAKLPQLIRGSLGESLHVNRKTRATIRKFGLSRISFRELALQGKVPGVIKASW